MTAFFSKHFGNFISKHTQWSLLSEPDSAHITPRVLNSTRRMLLELYASEIYAFNLEADQNLFHQDLNKVVAGLDKPPKGYTPNKGRPRKKRVARAAQKQAEKEERERKEAEKDSPEDGASGVDNDELARQVSNISDLMFLQAQFKAQKRDPNGAMPTSFLRNMDFPLRQESLLQNPSTFMNQLPMQVPARYLLQQQANGGGSPTLNLAKELNRNPELMALMRQQSPDKAEDLLRMPTNDFDLVRRLNLSSMLMQRQEN